MAPDIVRQCIRSARNNVCGTAPNAPPLFLWSLHHAENLQAPGALEDCLRAAADCVRDGTLLHIGLCNAGIPLIQRALATGIRVATVQNEWSPWCRDAEKARPPTAAASNKRGVLGFCAANDIIFVGYAPLGGLKSRRGERSLAADHPGLAALASAKKASVHAITLAAMLHRGRAIGARVVLIPGARVKEHAVDSVHAAKLKLTDAEVNAVLPPV
jgi:aryl-alcohol dehydrogenase-like predicted oxidoreductase